MYDFWLVIRETSLNDNVDSEVYVFKTKEQAKQSFNNLVDFETKSTDGYCYQFPYSTITRLEDRWDGYDDWGNYCHIVCYGSNFTETVLR